MIQFIYGFVCALLVIYLFSKYLFKRKYLSKVTKDEGRSLVVEFTYKGREYTTTLIRKKTQLLIGAEIIYRDGRRENIHHFCQNSDIIFPTMSARDFKAEELKITATPLFSGPTFHWSFKGDTEVNLELIEKLFAESQNSQKSIELGDE